jgi:hypothetical protein
MPSVQALFLELENGVFNAVMAHPSQNRCLNVAHRTIRAWPKKVARVKLGYFDNSGAFRKIRLQTVRHLRRNSEQVSARLE